MQCPKCQFEQTDRNTTCPGCGIVFAKYYKYHPRQNDATVEPEVEVVVHDQTAGDWRALLTTQQGLDNPLIFAGRGLVLLGLIIWSYRLIGPPIASNAVGESFLHLINLPFHEAGHILFRPLGAFMTSLGGTLG